MYAKNKARVAVRVLDPGHLFSLVPLDGDEQQLLRFVKRQGPKYPGNSSAYVGTTTQEVLRALIARTLYVDGQESNPLNHLVLRNLREALRMLEMRAAKRADRVLSPEFMFSTEPETYTTCKRCGHVECAQVCK
jgi:hypothetical protein